MFLSSFNFYALPIKLVYLIVFAALAIWFVLLRTLRRRTMRFIAGMLLAASVYVVLSYCVLYRTVSDVHQFRFASDFSDEFYREMLMNALLYFPLGLSLSVLIGPWAILAAFLLSLGIESWQYFAGTGLAQGTDVLCNTLGCAVGTIPVLLCGGCIDMKSSRNKIKETFRPLMRRLEASRLAPLCATLLDACYMMRYRLLGRPHIPPDDVKNVEDHVTFIFKSFNRQKMAKRLYSGIRAYYPGAAIVIADDSAEPLEIPGADIIHLPFNSGLSKGLIAALDAVKTEYVMRMDDDELLTPRSNIHGQFSFLQTHPEVDICAVQVSARPEASAEEYGKIKMNKELLIPAGTAIDGRIVVYKSPNCFLARTEKLRQVGCDPNIRMIDHHEFFYRAAGILVSVQDPHAYVLHCRNRFDREYAEYRNDAKSDSVCIREKHDWRSKA